MAGMFLPALAKVGSLKLPLLLRAAGITAGAAPSLMRGDIGGALIGGGLGAVGTLGLTPAAGMAQKGLTQAAVKGLGSKVFTPAGGALAEAARIAAPIGVGALAGGSAAGFLGGGARNVAKGAAGLAGYGTVGGEGMGGSPLPPGMNQYGGVLPLGDPLSVLSPLGLDAGRRLRTVKDAEALRDATNIVLPTVRKFSEQAKRDEFARSMAGAGIRQNIATNAALTENMQRAGLNLGMTAAQQAGDALTQRYNY